MQITVIIPIHRSERYPGKNERLAPYTDRWLKHMKAQYGDSLRIVTAGPVPIEPLLHYEHVTKCGTQRAVLAAAMDAAPADIYVEPQLTQPIRERWLLSACIGECLATGLSTVTAYRAPVDLWRVMQDGHWSAKRELPPSLIHDGSLFVWQPHQLADIFDASARHAVVVHDRFSGAIDVDYPCDMPHPLILEAMESVALAAERRHV